MQTVLVVGSSIFEQWFNAAQVAPDDRVVNLAVGGTVTAYWVAHLKAALTETNPNVILFYCGSNDLNNGVPDDQIIANVRACIAAVQAHNPTCIFVYFGIIKAPQKDGKFAQIDAINAALAKRLPHNGLYIESNDVFCPDDHPIARYFIDDGLHLTAAAYEALVAYVAPRLTARKN